MGFQDVAFLSSACLCTTVLRNVVGMKTSGSLHVLKPWLGVCRYMLPVRYFTPTMPLFVSVEFHGGHDTATKMRWIWPPSVLEILPCLKQSCV